MMNKTAKTRHAKRAQIISLSPTFLALAACGSDGDDPMGSFDIPDSYAVAMRGNGTTISSGTLGLDAGLSVSLASSPANGTATQNADGSVSYTPDTGYTGNDEIQVVISDGQGGSETVSIKLDIGAPGGDPLAADDKSSVAEDGQFSIIAKYGVLANDFDETDLSATLASGPANGTVTLNSDGSYVYTPNPDFNGQDAFTYTLTDEDGDTDTGTVYILVNPVNDAPVAADHQGGPQTFVPVITGQLQATDVDGDTLTYTLATQPSHGTMTIYPGGSYEYTANDPNFVGTDTFTYQVDDGNGGTDTATIEIFVRPENLPAFAAGFNSSGTDWNTIVNGQLMDVDPDGDTLTYTLTSAAANGTLTLSPTGAIVYTPNLYFFGTETVTYQSDDGNGGISTGTIEIDVAPAITTFGFTINGQNGPNGDRLGHDVAGIGDVNGDMIDDILIGAPRVSVTNSNSGAAYVVYGSTTPFPAELEINTLTAATGLQINGIDVSAQAGYTVSSAGDLNGDLIPDFAVGSWAADPNGLNVAGSTYVIFGENGPNYPAVINASTLNGTNGFAINGVDAIDRSGISVASLGDVNGDGFDDLVIGAVRAESGANTDTGDTYVIFGTNAGFSAVLNLGTMTAAQGFTLTGIDAFDESGSAVSGIADLNGDGRDEILITAKGGDGGLAISNSGEAYLIYGDATFGTITTFDLSTLNGTNGFTFNGVATNNFTGDAVTDIGDINNDGLNDIAIGGQDAGASFIGTTYVVYGAANISGGSTTFNLSSLNGTNGFAIPGLNTGDDSGRDVTGVGDVNGDGFDDFLIGAPGGDPNGNLSSGETYLIFGKAGSTFPVNFNLATLNGTEGYILNGIDASDGIGNSVSADDVNGDGVNDLLIGAYRAAPNGTTSGETYVVYGGLQQLAFMDIMDGQQDGMIDLGLLATPPVF